MKGGCQENMQYLIEISNKGDNIQLSYNFLKTHIVEQNLVRIIILIHTKYTLKS